jgi:hypothetical protein
MRSTKGERIEDIKELQKNGKRHEELTCFPTAFSCSLQLFAVGIAGASVSMIGLVL